MEKVVVTYTNADLDCVASAYAYAEYLNKNGDKAQYFISGKMQKEVEIVCSLFDIGLHNEIKKISNEQVIIVDTNTLSSVRFVSPQQIIEVIDHHPVSGDKFENAVVDIQQVGAVCTMIAERFKENGIKISKETAILLYYGIISNTVNFNSKVTTDRDKNIATWLKTQCSEIDDNLVDYIFKEKSKFNIEDLRIAMEVEEKFKLGDNQLIIGQLEIIEARDFLKMYEDNIKKIIEQVKEEYGVSFVFINIIDILNGYHMIYASNEETRHFLSKDYGYKFDGSVFEENRIVLRKEIKRYLRETLENNQNKSEVKDIEFFR